MIIIIIDYTILDWTLTTIAETILPLGPIDSAAMSDDR